MLVGTDVCFPMVFVWEKTVVPGENPPVWLGDHMTISYAKAGYWTRVAAVYWFLLQMQQREIMEESCIWKL